MREVIQDTRNFGEPQNFNSFAGPWKTFPVQLLQKGFCQKENFGSPWKHSYKCQTFCLQTWLWCCIQQRSFKKPTWKETTWRNKRKKAPKTQKYQITLWWKYLPTSTMNTNTHFNFGCDLRNKMYLIFNLFCYLVFVLFWNKNNIVLNAYGTENVNQRFI